jgi:AraC-like DNA-binding protein
MHPPGIAPAGRRRRVDWSVILGPVQSGAPTPMVVNRDVRGRLTGLLSVFDEILKLEDPDAILRRAVELARERIGLARVGLFLFDRSRNMMLGTWGSDLHGDIVDEHHVMYAVNETDREAFRRARDEGAHYTVFDNCPIVEHRAGETKVAGRGWTAWTPILSARGPIGILFNDGGLSGEPVDETRQDHAALLCSLLGTLLDPARNVRRVGAAGMSESAGRRLITAAVPLLEQDPSIGGKTLASRLGVSVGRFVRVFKAEMGMSLVEYRNRLRLDRFEALLANGRANMLETARAAGFGSYVQFLRVFRARRRMTPREYLRRS